MFFSAVSDVTYELVLSSDLSTFLAHLLYAVVFHLTGCAIVFGFYIVGVSFSRNK